MDPKLILNYGTKIWEYSTKIGFVFKQKIQVTQVQSLMNETNNLVPETLAIVEGPQTSVWIRYKGIELLLLLTGKDTRLCLASSHTSQ